MDDLKDARGVGGTRGSKEKMTSACWIIQFSPPPPHISCSPSPNLSKNSKKFQLKQIFLVKVKNKMHVNIFKINVLQELLDCSASVIT